MKTFSRDNRGGKKPWGGKSYGDDSRPRKFGFGSRDGGPATMHDATCAACGNPCQVPFRPNGRKPVLCGNCFKRDESAGPKRFERPSFGERRSFGKPPEARPQQFDTRAIEARLTAIEEKIDALIEAVTADEDEA
jgi:CxxC-x17-CxxC domain-containing protein